MVQNIANKELHLTVISDFLLSLNQFTNQYVLKGGTGLLYYGLDRFSEDIDLDGLHSYSLKSFIRRYCQLRGVKYTVRKDTPTVFRVHLYYNDINYIKVELSMRDFDAESLNYVNGVCVYSPFKIFKLKLKTLDNRYKLRDLYDMAFMYQSGLLRGLDRDYIVSLTETLRRRFELSSLDGLFLEQSDNILPPQSVSLMYDRILAMYDDLKIL